MKTYERGFTLVELLITIALVALMCAVAVPGSIRMLGAAAGRSDAATLETLLRHARADALNDRCEGPTCVNGARHGVKILADRFVLFQGDAYETRDRAYDLSFDHSAADTFTGRDEIVFATSSGDVPAPGAISMQALGRIVSISVGSEGQIQ